MGAKHYQVGIVHPYILPDDLLRLTRLDQSNDAPPVYVGQVNRRQESLEIRGIRIDEHPGMPLLIGNEGRIRRLESMQQVHGL